MQDFDGQSSEIGTFDHGVFTRFVDEAESCPKFLAPTSGPNEYKEISAQDNASVQDFCNGCLTGENIIAIHGLGEDKFWVLIESGEGEFKVAKVENGTLQSTSDELTGFISSHYDKNLKGLLVLKDSETEGETELWLFPDNKNPSQTEANFYKLPDGEKAMYISEEYYYFLDYDKNDIGVFGLDNSGQNKQLKIVSQPINLQNVNVIDFTRINSIAVIEGDELIIEDNIAKPELIVLAGDDGIYLLDKELEFKQIYDNPVSNLQMGFCEEFFNPSKDLTVTVAAPTPTIDIAKSNYTIVVGSGKDSITDFATIENCPAESCEIEVTSNSNNQVFTEIELSTDGTLTFSQNGKTGTDGFTVKACVGYNTHQECIDKETFTLSSVERPVIESNGDDTKDDSDTTGGDDSGDEPDFEEQLSGKVQLASTGQALRITLPSFRSKNSFLDYTYSYELSFSGAQDTVFTIEKPTFEWLNIPPGNWTLNWKLKTDSKLLNWLKPEQKSGKEKFTIVAPKISLEKDTWTMLGFGQNPFIAGDLDEDAELYAWDDLHSIGPYGGYKNRDEAGPIKAGQGYWYFGDSKEITDSNFNPKPQKINLESEKTGWNIIANPYGWNIEIVKNSKDSGDDKCWVWRDVEYEPVQILEPFEACWINVERPAGFDFNNAAYYDEVKTVLPKLSVAANDRQWLAQVSLQKGKWRDSYNYIGVDDREILAPTPTRGPGQLVALEIKSQGKSLHKHIQASGDNLSWEISAEVAEAGTANLQVQGIEHLSRYNQALVLKQGTQVQEVSPAQGVEISLQRGANNAELHLVPRSELAQLSRGLHGLKARTLSHGVELHFAVPLALQGQDIHVEWLALDGSILARQKVSNSQAGNFSMRLHTANPVNGLSFVRLRSGSNSISTKIIH